ncbi:MAG: tRNA (adenosine(37)-N6)-dimethylallyltransferase MiaA [Chloroflexi bacterium]|nr:tRNA (adenosine(37)-N6)-dimethylallyltransferase MiaA [Chloroflexota bacterium]
MTSSTQHSALSHSPLLVIVGATAVGKTALSLQLAQTFGGEIVSADSRLFYKGLDIGTAKPTAAERAVVPHHLIDICSPAQTISLGEYQQMAYEVMGEIHGRGRLPILVGGTGQYVQAVVEGWGIPRIPPQPALRAALESLGGDELARWLAVLDGEAAVKIDPRNVRRVIRALEATLVAGVPISTQQRKTPPPYRTLILGLHRERGDLYQRIDARVRQMVADGLVEEVQGLLSAGYGWELPALSGLGYRQLRPYLEGEQTLEEAIGRIQFETHRFVRQQKTWFQPDDERITWLDAAAEDLWTQAEGVVKAWVER